ncbi:hypothetical protein Goklo_018070, partial [Gossypium klotzschianum]|nr:hypothetical protein [Gossypium klotzschianum]
MDETPAEKLYFKDNLLLNRVLVESDNARPGAVGFELGEEDVVVENKGSIPEIHFSDRVHNLIDGSMGNVEILAGRLQLIGLDNEYFLVKFFNKKIARKCSWKDHGRSLPNRYYTKSIFRAIANVIGKVIKIDYNTTEGKRGHFAHLAVIVYLSKPLLPSLGIRRKYFNGLSMKGYCSFATYVVIMPLGKAASTPVTSDETTIDKARANSSRFNILDAIDETDC